MQARLAKMVTLSFLLLNATHSGALAPSDDPIAVPIEDRAALAAAVDQLCGKQIASPRRDHRQL